LKAFNIAGLPDLDPDSLNLHGCGNFPHEPRPDFDLVWDYIRES
jgi:hypothetical protein